MTIKELKAELLSKLLPLVEEYNYRAGWLGCEYESGKCDGISEVILMLDPDIDLKYHLKNSYAKLIDERKGRLEPQEDE